MANAQKFGGKWTEEKLDIFKQYLEAYLTALKNQSFCKIYIDAFAGSGEVIIDGVKRIDGSAKQALSAKQEFDQYFFIDSDPKNISSLQEMVQQDFPQLLTKIKFICGDANEELLRIINSTDWRHCRGLLFLDPFATAVQWTTVEAVADTKSIDMWYLFPFSALNRLLPKNGNIIPANATRIDRLLGAPSWRTDFYIPDPQPSLIPVFNQSGKVKSANPNQIAQYIVKRLETVFAAVSQNPKMFRNSNNSPMFLFCFAVSNPTQKAQTIAMRIANHILKN